MGSNEDGDAFGYFCEKDLLDFHYETDGMKKAHLQRKVNVQMYHEACARNMPKSLIASMVHTDLMSYSESSANEFATKFDEMLTNLAIDVNASEWECTLDDATTEDILSQNQCIGKYSDCAIDEITDREVAMLFDPIQSELNGNEMLNEANHGIDVSIINQMDEDDEGEKEVITFNLNINRTKNAEIGPNNFYQNEVSTSASNSGCNSFNPSNTWQSRPSFANTKRKYDDELTNTNCKQRGWARNNVNDECDRGRAPAMFKTAQDELEIQYEKRYGNSNGANQSYGTGRKTLGGRRTVGSPFVPPIAQQQQQQHQPKPRDNDADTDMYDNNDRLKHIDPKMIELIRSEIMDRFAPIGWEDIAGLEYAKSTIHEAVVLPILRPDMFTGLRRPPRGILLFGPPGTGKTLIGKCIASQSKSTFFSISASSLTSKWVGEGEKMVRTLFAVAAVHQPAVIFIDEIDSLLCQRSENEHESSRRVKTEFLVQLDGAGTGENDRILIVGATNRPQELDEAARRRFTKRLYIPLPEQKAREELLRNLLRSERTEIEEEQILEIGRTTDGFSGADLKVLCQEASMGPIRSIPLDQINMIDVNDMRALNYGDFQVALQRVRASVSSNDLQHYIEWDHTYGSGAGK